MVYPSSTSRSGGASGPTITVGSTTSTRGAVSGAQGGFAMIFGTGGMQFIMLLAFVAGLLCVFG